MTATYTTEANVKNRVNAVSGALSTANIELAINMAEGMIDAVMRKTGIGSIDFTYAAAKHGLITNTATALAGFMILTNDVELMSTSSTVSLTADMLWAEADRGLAILSDPRVNKFIREV